MQIFHSELLTQLDFNWKGPVGGPRILPRLPSTAHPCEKLHVGTVIDAGCFTALKLGERVEEQLRKSVAEAVKFNIR